MMPHKWPKLLEMPVVHMENVKFQQQPPVGTTEG